MSADTPRDGDLEQLLANAAALRQQYRAASQEEPPVALGEAIRAAARREVRARPGTAGSGFGASWRIPASIAAVVVVSVTVTVMVAQHDAHLPVTRERPSSGPSLDAGAAKDQPEQAPVHRIAKGQPDVGAPKAALQARPPAALPAASSAAPAEADVEKKLERPVVPQVESGIAPTAMESREEPSRTQTPAKTALPAAASPSAAMPAPSTPPEAAAKATADGTVSAQPLTKKRALSSSSEADSSASSWEKDPQTWLAHIEELRAAGRTEDAEASFRAFRSRYPDYRLPAGFVAPVP